MSRRRDFVLGIAGVAVLVLLYRRFGWAQVGATFARVQPEMLVAYLLLAGGLAVGYSARWRWIAASFGTTAPFRRFLAGRLAGDALGMLIPSARMAGDPVRVGLLRQSGGEIAPTIAGVATDRLVETLCSATAAVIYISVFAVIGHESRRSTTLITVAALLLVALLTPIVMMFRGVRPLGPFYPWLLRMRWPALRNWVETARAAEGELIAGLRRDPLVMVRAIVWSLALEGVCILAFYCLYAAFSLRLDFLTVILTLFAAGVSRAVPAPAGVGALEVSQLTVLTLMDGRAQTGFVVGMLMRLHETFWIVVGLLVLAFVRRRAAVRRDLAAPTAVAASPACSPDSHLSRQSL